MTKLSYLFYTLSLSLSFLTVNRDANANLNIKFDLEQKFQSRLQDQIRAFDDHALVEVRIELNKISLELPGTSLSANSIVTSGSENSIAEADIKGVEVSIVTSLTPFPEPLRTKLERILRIPSQKIKFQFEALPAIQAKPLKTEDSKPDPSAQNNGRFWIFLGAGLFLLASILIILWQNGKKQVTGLSSLTSQLTDAIRQMGDKNPVSALVSDPQVSKPQDQERFRETSPQNASALQTLSSQSLIALFTDCYWCELDAYAAYLWSGIPISTKKELLQQWSTLRDYSTYLMKVSPEAKDYHLHPFYIEAKAGSVELAQADLLQAVKKNPGIYASLSPIRQDYLMISLVDKLAWSDLPAQTLPSLSLAKIQLRALPRDISISHFSDSDELAVFANPNLIAPVYRPKLLSLVWLSLLDEQERTEILNSLTAQQIASVWIGPAEILAVIQKSLPEKKFNLAQEYLGQSKASRNSPVLAFVVKKSLERLKIVNVPESSTKAA